MLFVYPALAWAFALVSLPLLIHLINMMRHRRVKWAAMDFLLQSHRRMKHWVLLRQLLLLLTRMAAIALIVAMLAGLITSQSWSSVFGDRLTHHLILVDDSASMRERLGGGTAFESATQTASRIIENLARDDRPQRVSVILYSDVLRSAAGRPAPNQAARTRVDMDSTSITRVLDLLANLSPTQQSTPLNDVLEHSLGVIQELDRSEVAHVYVISDFRERDWGTEAVLREPISQLEEHAVQLNWINCARLPQDNLAITDVTIGNGTVVAGIPTMIKVSVRNLGSQTAIDVPVTVEMFGAPTGEADISQAGRSLERLMDQLPLTFDEIPPGDQVTRQTQVVFPNEGSFALAFRLPEDVLPLDNTYTAIASVQGSVPVLIVDGDPKLTSAFYLQSVFNPGPSVPTGVTPTSVSSSYLTSASLEDLQAFETIFLIDPQSLDERIRNTLRDYVEQGGGLAIYCGPETSETGLAELAETNLLPAPLQAPEELDPTESGAPDFIPGENSLFRVFAGERNPFLRRLVIRQYYPLLPDFGDFEANDIRVLGRLNNGDPLVLEHALGEGKVVTFLTSLGPVWNSWATNPSFIVTVLELRSYLSPGRQVETEFPVGAPIAVTAPIRDFRPDVQFFSPGANYLPTSRTERVSLEETSSSLLGQAQLHGVDPVTGSFLTGQTGVYEAWLTRLDGSNEVRRFALTSDLRESELLGLNEATLRQLYPGINFHYYAADAWQYDDPTRQGTNWQMILLALVIGALLLEQVLAYYASYHPAAPGAAVA